MCVSRFCSGDMLTEKSLDHSHGINKLIGHISILIVLEQSASLGNIDAVNGQDLTLYTHQTILFYRVRAVLVLLAGTARSTTRSFSTILSFSTTTVFVTGAEGDPEKTFRIHVHRVRCSIASMTN